MGESVHQALVTGASRGIGRAIALELAEQNHKVVVNYHRREDLADDVAAAIRDRGGCCELLPFDVSDHLAVKKVLSRYIKEHGTVDIVVNNAGVTRDQLLPLMKFEAWDEVIRTTLSGFFAVTKPCIPGMLKQKWGRVINISSLAGLVGSPGQTNYSAAKAGLIGATRSLSAELCSRNILVNAVAPGFIQTDMLDGLPVPLEEIIKRIPMGRLGRPEEVAKLTAFLASDQASYITGQVIGINGGIV